MTEIKQEHKQILDKIIETYVISDGDQSGHTPEDFGLNESSKSKDDGLWVHLSCGLPSRLYTPEGYYTIPIGAITYGKIRTFLKNLGENFNILAISRDMEGSNAGVELENLVNLQNSYIKIQLKA